jgi:hypothetical protein
VEEIGWCWRIRGRRVEERQLCFALLTTFTIVNYHLRSSSFIPLFPLSTTTYHQTDTVTSSLVFASCTCPPSIRLLPSSTLYLPSAHPQFNPRNITQYPTRCVLCYSSVKQLAKHVSGHSEKLQTDGVLSRFTEGGSLFVTFDTGYSRYELHSEPSRI